MKKPITEPQDAKDAIKYWKSTLAMYKNQAKRGYIKGTDILPLWLGASDQESIEWIEEEIRLLKKVSKK